jgi:hypothetical protein
MNSGRCLLDDGSFANKISNVMISLGEKVLVWSGLILKIHVEDSKPVYLPKAELVMILCYLGDTTADYSRDMKFYKLQAGSLTEKYDVSPYTLIDDGAYGLVWDGIIKDDPKDYEYVWVPIGGLGVPVVSNGTAAKQMSGNTIRAILNQSMEDEAFLTIRGELFSPPQYVQRYLQPYDPLSSDPFAIIGRKPFVSRYVTDGIITIHTKWGDFTTTLVLDGWYTWQWGDLLPAANRIYRENFTGGLRSFVEINNEGLGGKTCLIAARNYTAYSYLQKVIRPKTFADEGYWAEPSLIEDYDLTNIDDIKFLIAGTVFNRCSDTESDTCYMRSALFISGKTYQDPVSEGWPALVDNTGFDTIANDIKLPFSILDDNKMDYVRMQKDREFNKYNTSVYCNNVLVEESGWLAVTKLWGDNPKLSIPDCWGEYNGPILIRNISYKILHAYHDENFHCILYRKTVFDSTWNELTDHKPLCEFRPEVWWAGQARKTCVLSTTKYYLYINGKKIEVPGNYQCNNKEYYLTAKYDGGAENVRLFGQFLPWLDVGYDKNGEIIPPEEEDNSIK